MTLLSLTAVFSLIMFLRQQAEKDTLEVKVLPYFLGGWKGRDLEPEPGTYDILETHNLVLREYEKKVNKAYLLVVYSETKRTVFHPPEVCAVGSGLSILKNDSVLISLDGRDISVNEIIASSDQGNQVILYTYVAGDSYVRNYYLQQMYFVFNQIFGKNKSGAMIRVSMPEGKNREATVVVLKDFMGEAIREIESLEALGKK
jgi:EpsI family protein